MENIFSFFYSTQQGSIQNRRASGPQRSPDQPVTDKLPVPPWQVNSDAPLPGGIQPPQVSNASNAQQNLLKLSVESGLELTPQGPVGPRKKPCWVCGKVHEEAKMHHHIRQVMFTGKMY